MIRERTLNGLVLVLLLAVPLWAMFNDQPFTITLATRAVIFALAAVGLNIALGLGGLVSLGHAAFFGIGGYAMGILAHHAQTYTPVMELPFLIEGTKSMPVIWLVAMVTSGIAAFLIGILSLRTAGVYYDHAGIRTNVLFFLYQLGCLWR
jgi:branched-chain amino acid transport system permease protein